MSCASWGGDRRALERELGAECYRELLNRLHGERSLLAFRTWAEAATRMWGLGPDDPGRDEILRPILRHHGRDRDPRWRSVLLLFFWPELESVHRFKRRCDRCMEERWQNLVWTFLQVVSRLDVGRRPDRITRKVRNDTAHRLSDAYRSEWAWLKAHVLASPELLNALAGPGGCNALDAVECRDERDARVRNLESLAARGRLDEADVRLLVATRVRGQSLAEYARATGLSYQMLKKRRQRAESRLGAGRKTGNS